MRVAAYLFFIVAIPSFVSAYLALLATGEQVEYSLRSFLRLLPSSSDAQSQPCWLIAHSLMRRGLVRTIDISSSLLIHSPWRGDALIKVKA